MKIFLIIILLFNSLFIKSQISSEEIKKHRIYKVVEKYFVQDSLKTTTTYFYDKHGNIFKKTWGKATEKTISEYEGERLKKTIDYDLNGKEEHTSEFFYNPDGSYMTITTEKNFGAKIYFWYKANGDVIKAFGGDTAYYKYNEQGKLVSIDSRDSGQEMKFHFKYSYDTKGQLIKVESPQDEFNNTTENYEYDENGKLIKSIMKKILHGMTSTSLSSYEYNKKGRLVKVITVHTDEWGKTTTKNIYKYQFYKN